MVDLAGGTGKVIILTGAGGGIGFSITQQLLSSPAVALLVAIGLKTGSLEPLSDAYGARLVIKEGDVSDRKTSQRAVDTAIRSQHRLDAVILNAGSLQPVGPVADTQVWDWKRLFNTNFFSLLHTIQLALPYLRRTQGQILMTSSGVSLQPHAAWIAYSCTKSAMNCLAAGLAKEEEQVSTLCITPGIVNTGMQAEVRNEHKSNMPGAQYEWLSTLKAKGELLRPEKPASSFVKLALEGISAELKGQVIGWDDTRISKKL